MDDLLMITSTIETHWKKGKFLPCSIFETIKTYSRSRYRSSNIDRCFRHGAPSRMFQLYRDLGINREHYLSNTCPKMPCPIRHVGSSRAFPSSLLWSNTAPRYGEVALADAQCSRDSHQSCSTFGAKSHLAAAKLLGLHVRADCLL